MMRKRPISNRQAHPPATRGSSHRTGRLVLLLVLVCGLGGLACDEAPRANGGDGVPPQTEMDGAVSPGSDGSVPSSDAPLAPPPPVPPGPEWNMVAANPARTSWVSTEVRGNLKVEWYRPVEAYIDQKVQLIAALGFVYVSTSRGLIALRADNGGLVWRFDTELPLGNSPTVDRANRVLYVAGFDRKLHALDAQTGQPLWSFSGAGGGYNTNPLVVEGKVILGNRDGSSPCRRKCTTNAFSFVDPMATAGSARIIPRRDVRFRGALVPDTGVAALHG